MTGQTAADGSAAQLRRCHAESAACRTTDDIDRLIRAIRAARRVPVLTGDVAALRALADAYQADARFAEGHLSAPLRSAEKAVGSAWTGQAATAAHDALELTAHQLDALAKVMERADGLVRRLADALQQAQEWDRSGMFGLMVADGEAARAKAVSPPDRAMFEKARNTAVEGARQRAQAFESYEKASWEASREFRGLRDGTRLSRAAFAGLPAAKVAGMVEATIGGGSKEPIVGSHALRRASEQYRRLSDADRQRFDRLMNDAASPHERAYLTKALATGRPMDQIERFDARIHPHGGDPAWLQAHLNPTPPSDSLTAKDRTAVEFAGHGYSQKGYTCAAASTVTARAEVDPLYALYLTTGGPDDPAGDSGPAFQDRFLAEQNRNAGLPRGDFGKHDGLNLKAWEHVVDTEVGAPQGADYATVEARTPQQRRQLLAEIEGALDRGQPVPIRLGGERVGDEPKSAHALVFLRRQGDRLEAYNPWGETTWVTESEFVDGHMHRAAPHTVTFDQATHVMVPR
ncbi:WXG100 family type VII secretion target [Catellatospora tritici]|uniref:WXG100 family type VII secretion target n=1 Tax=Catellatospora tritici TaxID=2851566 RepID=UPI001C2DBB2C|nr:WXG100 family type VII secretion target [Catellatospora tritici]MBV1853563.1 WXG100 family type VII secretion target [Catellatospora tritici]